MMAATIQRKITLTEYNAIPPEFRGVWTTERDDLPDWPQVRHMYMGKRTMMSSDGSCTLLVEGMEFEIIDDTRHQLSAALHVLRAVTDTIKELGSVPSGHLYMNLTGLMTLRCYETIIDTLVRSELIRRDGHMLIWNSKLKESA